MTEEEDLAARTSSCLDRHFAEILAIQEETHLDRMDDRIMAERLEDLRVRVEALERVAKS